jgi:hypothetical protein
LPIRTPEDLRQHLALAIRVELATIPPYLYAMYSIEDQRSEAALLIRSIVAEEMLHAALVSNLLLAVGGRPRFDTTELIPTYPGWLPHHEPPLQLRLAPCSLELVKDMFMRIEQPEVHGAPTEPDVFETLGQFYHALEIGIENLARAHDLFADPQRSSQLSDPGFYAPVEYDAEDSGGLVLIDDVDSALAAIAVVVHQGEGLSNEKWADPAHQELTHYFKLLDIYNGTSPLGPVRSLMTDPRTSHFPESLRPASDFFNACYRFLFYILDELFSPIPDKDDAVERMYRMMAEVMSAVARFLVTQPVGNDRFAGPTFEIWEFGGEAKAELLDLARMVARGHGQLAHVVERVEQI